jgi:predicted membrane protein
MKPRELTEKEIKKLQKQFPINKQELERLKENKKERLKNKLEILAIIFLLAMALIMVYLFYLTFTYQV